MIAARTADECDLVRPGQGSGSGKWGKAGRGVAGRDHKVEGVPPPPQSLLRRDRVVVVGKNLTLDITPWVLYRSTPIWTSIGSTRCCSPPRPAQSPPKPATPAFKCPPVLSPG